jgi:hypothetical protein
MDEKRGMPPWFFVLATIVSLLMVALYVQMTFEEGLSLWMAFRIVFWIGLMGVFIWMFGRARAARSGDSRFGP